MIEAEQIRQAFREHQDYNPHFAFIVVKKRVNARFFVEDQLRNPRPGTIIDRGVVSRNGYDFYMIAQHVNQGSATPTHYHVLIDQSQLTADQIQFLTYKLCHLYFNWSATVKVPAPCQYAHKLAKLIGQSIHQETHKRIEHLLFYL